MKRKKTNKYKLLKQQCDDRGISLAELSRRAGVPLYTMYYLKRTNSIKSDNWEKLQEVLS